MKKLFEQYEFKSIKTDIILPKDIQQDIEDICLELDDLKIDYCRSLGFKCKFVWENSFLQIFSIRDGSIAVDYPIESISDVTERIQRYLEIKKHKCKIFYEKRSKHYYRNVGEEAYWHEITGSTIIVFYKDKIEVKY